MPTLPDHGEAGRGFRCGVCGRLRWLERLLRECPLSLVLLRLQRCKRVEPFADFVAAQLWVPLDFDRHVVDQCVALGVALGSLRGFLWSSKLLVVTIDVDLA